MAFVISPGKTPVVYKRLEDLSDPLELRELNRMLFDIIKRLNAQQVAATAVSGNLAFNGFIGTGSKSDFDLDGRVKSGTTPLVSVQGNTQDPATSWEVQPFNDLQDRIHFNWTPQSGRIIMVWFEPA